MGRPPVELHSLLTISAPPLPEKGQYVPDLVFSGGFTMEDQIFKGLALGAVREMYRHGPRTTGRAMVAKTIGRQIGEDTLPVYVERFGRSRNKSL